MNNKIRKIIYKKNGPLHLNLVAINDIFSIHRKQNPNKNPRRFMF